MAVGFDQVAGGFSPRFASRPSAERALRVTLPARATEPVLLQHTGSAVGVAVSLKGALAAAGHAADGYMVYAKALASGATLLHRALPTGTEDFVSFEKPPSEPELSYELALGADVAGLRLVASTLELLDRSGAPRLRVSPPYVVGADGARTEATLAVEGCAVDTNAAAPWGRAVTQPGARNCTMRVRWSDAGVRYPAVLDPRWTTTGSMASARQDHTATLLPLTGKVLVVGGRATSTSTTGLASAELYDKSTGTWAATGSLASGRWAHTATLLNSSSNGATSQKILVAGGINGTTSVASAQLYDQAAGTWTAAGNLNAARHLHTATLLADGRVLVAGGMNGTAVLHTAALYDPSHGTGTWAATTGPIPPNGWRSGTATLLQTSNAQLNNKVLLAGGNDGTKSIASVFLFDPAQSAFSTLASMPSAREGHTSVVLANKKVLFVGGQNGSTALATAVIFDPGSGPGSWSTTGSMTSPRSGHALSLLPVGVAGSGQVIVSGGSNGTSTLSSTEVWNGSTWSLDGSMVLPVQKHTAVALGNDILIAGGANGSTTVSAAELYDPSLGLQCSAGSQCASGFCVSGVCCDTACDGGCGSCSLSGKVGVCSPIAAGTTCRASAGACDSAESCSGTSVACPADGFAGATTVCRTANGSCDVPENCTGTSPACPPDTFSPPTTFCRPAAGPCDIGESCTGTTAACPADAFAANGSSCTDGNSCTDGDACQSGACVSGAPRTCSAPDQCHLSSCDPATGACSTAAVPDGTSCNDGNACTQTDTCQSGSCVGANPVACAANPCRAPGVCDPASGACSVGDPVADFTACDDGDRCNHGKACHAGSCSGGEPICEDGDPCTVDSCDSVRGSCQFTSSQCSPIALKGRVAYATEPDNNRCVPHAAQVLNRMNARGDLMAWQYDAAGYAGLDGSYFHNETMLRLPYFGPGPNQNLDGSYFVSAFSHPPLEDIFNHPVGARMGVAHMGFKGGNQGKMLLSNRAFNAGDQASTFAADWQVAPNPADTYVPVTSTTSSLPDLWLDPDQFGFENHPGGGAAIGHYVIMTLQNWTYDNGFIGAFCDPLSIFGIGCEGKTDPASQPLLQVWNMANPTSPTMSSQFLTYMDPVPDDSGGNSAVAAAITKLNDGHFLLAFYKDTPVAQMEFYVSASTNIDDPHLFGDPNRQPDAIVPSCGPNYDSTYQQEVQIDSDGNTELETFHTGVCETNPYDWQTFNFITDCNGDLFVIGARGGDEDLLDNFKVELTKTNSSSDAKPSYNVVMTRADLLGFVDGVVPKGLKHMYCSDNSDNDRCDFQAAAGTYVDPNGQLIVYATNYDDDGGGFLPLPFVYGNGVGGEVGGPWSGQSCAGGLCPALSGYYQGVEFHERHGSSAPGSACPTMDDAWVEFYQDPEFNDDGGTAGQLYRANYPSAREHSRFMGDNDFNDKTRSVRWCVPPDSSIQIFHDVWSGEYAYLNGTGRVAEIADLSSFKYPYSTDSNQPGTSLTGSITSFRFQPGVTDPQGTAGLPETSN